MEEGWRRGVGEDGKMVVEAVEAVEEIHVSVGVMVHLLHTQDRNRRTWFLRKK